LQTSCKDDNISVSDKLNNTSDELSMFDDINTVQAQKCDKEAHLFFFSLKIKSNFYIQITGIYNI